jgi:ribosomal protein L27
MKNGLLAFVLTIFIGGVFASALQADDSLARFKGGIGVHPVSNVTVGTTTTVNPNTVRGISPAGQLWVIEDLDARVKTNGDIVVRGKGLILAGGNNAGRTSGQSVFATLICEAAAPFVEHSTNLGGVPLAPNGDFKIDDVLTPLPTGACASPMLLIRTAGSGAWFAVGIPSLD